MSTTAWAAAPVGCRAAQREDLSAVAALALHVFVDTYAPEGLTPALGDEVAARFAPSVLADRWQDPATHLLLAECGGCLVGLADLNRHLEGPVPDVAGTELLRLYVHPRFQRRGVGRALLGASEAWARAQGAAQLWLTAWEGNAPALAFYPRVGYEDVGESDYWIDGVAYRNRVYRKRL